MVSSRFPCFLCFSFFFFFFIPISHRRLAIAQPDFQYHLCVKDAGNYTSNSTYKSNLDHLLSTFTTDHQIDYGFYNFSYGHDHKANAIGLCRGDLIPEACRSCLNDSITLLTKLCPNQIEAIGWYDDCMLRYSDRSLFGFMEASPAFYGWDLSNASDPIRFTNVSGILLKQLTRDAASGDSRLKFATGSTGVPNFPVIYMAVQCTPDLSPQDCTNCLLGAVPQIDLCCSGRVGGRIGRPSCNFRFQMSKFFQEAPPSTRTPPFLSNPPAKGNAFRTVVLVIVPVIVVVVVAVVVIIISIRAFPRTRKLRSSPAKNLPGDESTSVESLLFDFDTIRIATDGFSDANELGNGGFGAVYKGRLPDGQDIAVKRLFQGSSQRDDEFKNEVLLVAKLQHRNLVQLLGYCFKKNEKLLVYEFVENSSLEKFLFDPVKRESLDWKTRYNIIEGIARGLVYLHEDSQLKIIHRDLKASNILLDADMDAKISDFGTAKLFVCDQTQGDTRRVVGTYGYMAPEYVLNGRFSTKSDVFSFGVLILEIVTGQKNNRVRSDEEIIESLVCYAWRNWQRGTALDIIDPCLKVGSRTEIARCFHIGLLCVQENLVERPTMTNILLMLNSSSITLPRPSQPAFYLKSICSQMYVQSEHISTQDSNMSFTELYPR